MGVEIEGEIDFDKLIEALDVPVEEIHRRAVEKVEENDPTCECGSQTFHLSIGESPSGDVVPFTKCEGCGREEIVEIDRSEIEGIQ